MGVRDVVSGVRVVTAVAVLVSAAFHLWLWVDGVRNQDVIGELFLVNVVSGAVIAALLLTWAHWLGPFLAAGFGATTLGAFLVAATVGLFGLETGWSWYAVVAAVSEVVAIIGGLAAIAGEQGAGRSAGQPQHG